VIVNTKVYFRVNKNTKVYFRVNKNTKVYQNQEEKKNLIKSMHPNDKEKRKSLYKDGRKTNTKENRIYEFIDGKILINAKFCFKIIF
jgi:hypothetical protein